jgi:hypothetical protein
LPHSACASFWLPDVELVASPQVTDEGLPSTDMTVHQPPLIPLDTSYRLPPHSNVVVA